MPFPLYLDREEFIYHTETALDVAKTAEAVLQAAEHHLQLLVKEEELSLRVLKDEIEAVRSRSQAARHQIASLRATLQTEGVTPKYSEFVALLDEDTQIGSPQQAGPSAGPARRDTFRD